MDDDGAGGPPVPIKVTITVAGDQIALDWTGTGAQVPGDINVVYLALVATVYYALKALLDPTIPANGGFYRAIRVDAPEGSIVNARPPAPVAWRTQTCQRIADVVFGALAPALPERVIARHQRRQLRLGLQRHRPAHRPVLRLSGDARRRLRRAGRRRTASTRCRCTSPTPRTCPWSAWRWSIRSSSRNTRWCRTPAAPGRHRGGLGLRRTIRVRGGEATFLGTLDRARFAPWGLFGGARGRHGVARPEPGHAGGARAAAQGRRPAPGRRRRGDDRHARRGRLRPAGGARRRACRARSGRGQDLPGRGAVISRRRRQA